MKTRCSRPESGSISELPLSLVILLVLITFPLINLVGVALGAATSFFIVRQTASVASTQPSFAVALSAMQNQAITQLNSGFARFLKIQPIGGYNNCGVDLYIKATNFRTANDVEKFGPNLPVPPPVDVLDSLYECSTQGVFEISPVIDMAGIPWIGSVPGLGRPIDLTFTADRVAEYPTGLQAGTGAGIVGTSMPPQLNTAPSVPNTTGVSGSGWNYPNIYDLIAAAGETVVSQNVLQVYANNPSWTPSGVTVNPGDQVWIDYTAAGRWQPLTDPSNPGLAVNANGYVCTNCELLNGFTNFAMLGRMDNPASPFLLGASQLNMTPPGTGQLYMIVNDGQPGAGLFQPQIDYEDNTGVMTVKVIVTR